ncbi:hypothetical protein NDU88_003780 [Pleurodeles waltl]|uniref:Uncharacterized protein n=1 Tax=Pleurodeles waltl TaxID=8319 RepID=A0AAV7MT80_PLEWA|nr:hypothetical protein NDU88_003780 [Pleurodeles waltl]
MGTLAASLPRFPIPRETLETFRAAGGQKNAGRDEGRAGVNGERKTDRGEGAEQWETTEQEADDSRDEENEATQEGAPEARTQEPSHEPGGSWLTKLDPTALCCGIRIGVLALLELGAD